MSLSRNTTSGTKKIILDYESKYFCLYDNVNNSSQYSIFDFDLSLGTVLNQLNLPVLFLLLTALWLCFRVSFSSVLYQQLCQGFSAASKNVPQESTLMTTTRKEIQPNLWRDVTRNQVSMREKLS